MQQKENTNGKSLMELSHEIDSEKSFCLKINETLGATKEK